MKLVKILFTILIILSLFSSIAIAGDFDWLKDLSIQAEADQSGFRVSLGARFQIGDVEINAVLSNVEEPADAYMVLRLAEMSRQPTDYVVTQYRSQRDKGWGVLAKNLGIKPGSNEFHALKNGHDLQGDRNIGASKTNRKGKGKGKYKNR